jgi:hypothetical protein
MSDKGSAFFRFFPKEDQSARQTHTSHMRMARDAARITLKITSGKISAAWILALGLSVSAGVPGTASAVTLMDLLRGGPGKVERERERQDRGLPGVTQPGIAATRDVDPEPLPRVAAPRYYTYKADSTRAIDSSKFASGLAGVKVSATPEIAKAVEAYYNAGGAPIWVSNGDLNVQASFSHFLKRLVTAASTLRTTPFPHLLRM